MSLISTPSSPAQTCLLGVGAGSAAALLAAFVLVVQGQVAQAEQRRHDLMLASQTPAAARIQHVVVVNALQQPRFLSASNRVKAAPATGADPAPRLITVSLRTGDLGRVEVAR